MRDFKCDVKEQPIEYIYKNVPVWVVRNLKKFKNCSVGRKTYKRMQYDLPEYFSKVAEEKKEIGAIQSEGGGYYLWVK